MSYQKYKVIILLVSLSSSYYCCLMSIKGMFAMGIIGLVILFVNNTDYLFLVIKHLNIFNIIVCLKKLF